MAAIAPARREAALDRADYAMEGSDVDAEGEEDVEIDYAIASVPDAVKNVPNTTRASRRRQTKGDEDEGEEKGEDEAVEGSKKEDELSDANGVDGEEDEEGDDEHEAVGAVKLPEGVELNSDGEQIENGESDEDGNNSEDEGSDDQHSSANSNAVEEWADASTGEGEGDVANRNNCM